MDMLQNRFFPAVHQTSRAWRSALEGRLKCRGLSQAGWLAVAAVVNAERALSQSELAQYLGLQSATMVPMIDRLVVAGLVTRTCSCDDNRVRLVMITSAGLELYQQVKIEVDLLHEELLSTISRERLLQVTETLEMVQRIAESLR